MSESDETAQFSTRISANRELAEEALQKAEARRRRQTRLAGKAKPRGRPFAKGHGKLGGRTKGSVNPVERYTERQRVAIGESGISPLEFMVNVMRDESIHLEYRLEAAKAVLPFLHRRMPVAIEGGDCDKPVVFDTSLLIGLTTQEKKTLLELFDKMTLTLPAPKPIIEASAPIPRAPGGSQQG